MNERARLTVVISSRGFPCERVVAWLAPKLSEWFAGATFCPVTGAWSADGDQTRPAYAAGESEPGLMILVSVLPEDRDRAVERIRELLRGMKAQLGLEISWVHLEEERVRAHHFRLD
jgi:hypothetical protein